MASLSDAELSAMSQDDRAKALGMTTEQLTGRSLLVEFSPDEEERFEYCCSCSTPHIFARN